jgi:hypothetical protein
VARVPESAVGIHLKPIRWIGVAWLWFAPDHMHPHSLVGQQRKQLLPPSRAMAR